MLTLSYGYRLRARRTRLPRQLFTSLFIPGGTKEQADWFNELQRISASPEDAVRNLIANGDVDVGALLSQVTVPTLVMHMLATMLSFRTEDGVDAHFAVYGIPK